MKKIVKNSLIGIVLILLCLILFLLCSNFLFRLRNGGHFSDTISIVRNTNETKATFYIETVSSSKDTQKGLSNRNSLKEGRGMYFVFQTPSKGGFWMKDMRFPLDIIFIDSNNTIIEIAQNQAPCKEECPIYTPSKEYLNVLEINGGLVEKFGIKVGDRVLISVP